MSSDFELEEFNGLGTTLAPRIPNAENRTLETKIETKQRRFQSTQHDLDEHLTKVHMLEDHLKNVQDELGTTQKLFNARKHEVETEEHMKILNEREIGRLKQDILRLENEITNIKDRKSTLADEVFRANQLFDEMKAQMKWDQQALEAWLEESAQKDEDVMALMKYTRQDEAKVKELMFKIERMTDEANKKKRSVEGEIMDTTSLQVELDKTASNFRHAHRHRQELITRWEDIIGQMHQRDRDIDLLAAQLVKIKAEARSVEEQIIEKREFYDNEQRNNNERQLQMSMAERQAGKLRTQYEDAEKNRLLYENELSGLRRVVKRTEKDKENAYALLSQMKKQLTSRKQYLEDVMTRKNDLIEKKREILDTKYTAEEKANKMDKLYLDEQEREMKLNSELKLLSERMYKITQEIFDYKTKEKNLEADINGSVVTLNNLQAKTNRLDHEALKQQEVLYHQAAQEKEELQREGDELDAKNRKAEQELLALQNTLRIINSGNNQTKQSFKKLPESSDELSRLEELEEQSRHLMDKVRTKRRKAEDMRNDLKRTERAFEELLNDQGALENVNQEKRQQVGKLENDVKDMDAKLVRADKSSHLDDLSSIASTPSSVRSSSTRSSISQPSRTSSRQAIPVASVQLGLDGSRPPSLTGQRQQRASSRGSSTASSSSTSSARRVVH
ncbi:unnamed protein product [Rotaria magnacalcarata]|uniref:Coiled-coil domain-containing protein 39 n=1 Tax=Rotaria magnacalcarata TaxID=392030 RepID=A0A8S2LRT3_9BILA|nr:unnamed protein product [Rotaria magnacalcarata]